MTTVNMRHTQNHRRRKLQAASTPSCRAVKLDPFSPGCRPTADTWTKITVARPAYTVGNTTFILIICTPCPICGPFVFFLYMNIQMSVLFRCGHCSTPDHLKRHLSPTITAPRKRTVTQSKPVQLRRRL